MKNYLLKSHRNFVKFLGSPGVTVAINSQLYFVDIPPLSCDGNFVQLSITPIVYIFNINFSPPSIYSVVVGDGVITVTGMNFGTNQKCFSVTVGGQAVSFLQRYLLILRN